MWGSCRAVGVLRRQSTLGGYIDQGSISSSGYIFAHGLCRSKSSLMAGRGGDWGFAHGWAINEVVPSGR